MLVHPTDSNTLCLSEVTVVLARLGSGKTPGSIWNLTLDLLNAEILAIIHGSNAVLTAIWQLLPLTKISTLPRIKKGSTGLQLLHWCHTAVCSWESDCPSVTYVGFQAFAQVLDCTVWVDDWWVISWLYYGWVWSFYILICLQLTYIFWHLV